MVAQVTAVSSSRKQKYHQRGERRRARGKKFSTMSVLARLTASTVLSQVSARNAAATR